MESGEFLMYTVQKNPAAVRSQELICQAVRNLMTQLPFGEITVTRICQEANVGRKTFYRNFERKEDAVAIHEMKCRSVILL